MPIMTIIASSALRLLESQEAPMFSLVAYAELHGVPDPSMARFPGIPEMSLKTHSLPQTGLHKDGSSHLSRLRACSAMAECFR